MDKEFVTHEQALALKELGFDRTCLASYADKIFYLVTHRNNLSNKTFVAAPLKQQVFRWFREKYNLSVYITDRLHCVYDRELWKCVVDDVYYGSMTFDTYEEAENACIDKLIEVAKQKER